MASVLNRTTKEVLPSVNTPDYSPKDWIINPDLTAVNGFPSKYWIITGDVVTLMSDVERAAVDAAEATTADADKAAKLAADVADALTESAKTESPAKTATDQERIRALEFKVFGG